MSASPSPEVVVVTGASAGIGRAVAHAFARRGAHIGLIARAEESLNEAREEVEALGGKAIVVPADVSHPDEVEAAADAVEGALGPIDIWVNDAMVSVFAPFKEMDLNDFKRVTEVTYLGYVNGTHVALKRMLPRDSGTIVQVGSALAYRGIPLQSAYCGAKHAIQGFTESVRTELWHDGSKVGIIMVQMPAVNTPQFRWVKNLLPHKAQPVPPIYQPEVAAEAVYYAAHHPYRRELWVGASTAVVLTLNKFMPKIGDWYLSRTGYKSQQTSEPRNPRRPNNLYEPQPQMAGTHGDFDSRSYKSSPELWLTMNRRKLGVATSAVAAGLIAALALLRRSEPAR